MAVRCGRRASALAAAGAQRGHSAADLHILRATHSLGCPSATVQRPTQPTTTPPPPAPPPLSPPPSQEFEELLKDVNTATRKSISVRVEQLFHPEEGGEAGPPTSPGEGLSMEGLLVAEEEEMLLSFEEFAHIMQAGAGREGGGAVPPGRGGGAAPPEGGDGAALCLAGCRAAGCPVHQAAGAGSSVHAAAPPPPRAAAGA
jgi:hypothetical protein